MQQVKEDGGHKNFQTKIKYDLMKFVGYDGINWVKELPEERVLNDNTKEVIGYMMPFHVFNGWKSNFIQNKTIEQ